MMTALVRRNVVICAISTVLRTVSRSHLCTVTFNLKIQIIESINLIELIRVLCSEAKI